MTARRTVTMAMALLLLVLLGLSLGGLPEEALVEEPPTDACAVASAEPGNRLAAAACRALGPFVRMELTSPLDVLLADVTARRFGVAALSQLWAAYQKALRATPSLELRVYARVGDAAVRVTPAELRMLNQFDAFTAPALYCREHPLPADYADTLTRALREGQYSVTHVLMALFWLRERSCAQPVSDALFDETLAATASLIDADHAQITDLELEAAAFLAHVGEARQIAPGFLDGVIASQLPGGGWSAGHPMDAPSGHSSGLGLLYLHELLFPGRTTPTINPLPRQR